MTLSHTFTIKRKASYEFVMSNVQEAETFFLCSEIFHSKRNKCSWYL